MSGSVAARYVGALPYDPSLGVSQYARAPRLDGPAGATANTPAFGVPGGAMIDSQGQAVRVSPAAATVPQAVAGGGGIGGMDPMMLALATGALGLLPYLPDAVDWAGRQFAPDAPAAASQQMPADPTPLSDGMGAGGLDAGTFVGPGGVQIPNAALGGFGTNWNNVFEPGWSVIDDPASLDQLLRPIEYAPSATDGFQAMGASPSDFASVSAPAASPTAFGGAAQTLPDDWLAGSLGETPYFGGDLATLGAGTLGSAAGGLISSQAFQNDRGAYTQYGQQAGSALGGIGGAAAVGALYGSALGPIGTGFGALAGALIGGMGGGAGASTMGPAPTIGRNFGTTGTFGGDGGIQWGAAGGDNGGTGAEATQFGGWLSNALADRARQQGLAFNPNMSGAQLTIGGYDNFSRRGETPGGYFYTPGQAGASPENYALRPNAGLDPFSSGQANAFADSVLADLTARGVYGGPGASGQQGLDYFNSTLGADLGGYGYQTWGQQDLLGFGDLLSQRQGAIGGFLGQQQQNAAAEAAARAQLDQSNRWGGLDTGGISATNLLLAQNDAGMAANLGLQGAQATENGFIFAQPGGNPYAAEPGWNTGGG